MKMATLPKAVYRFNAIPIQILTNIFIDNKKKKPFSFESLEAPKSIEVWERGLWGEEI